MTNSHIGVMLMTYGSPATLEDIPTYLTNVRGGRLPEEELLQNFDGGTRLLAVRLYCVLRASKLPRFR